MAGAPPVPCARPGYPGGYAVTAWPAPGAGVYRDDPHGHDALLSARTTQWTAAEDEVITEAVSRFGCKWTTVCSFLPGRTVASVRNRWHRLQRARRSHEPLKDGGYRCGRCGKPKRGHVCRITADKERVQIAAAKERMQLKAQGPGAASEGGSPVHGTYSSAGTM
mmetsp:Transcript_3417/g.11366  ORF Transcript_3417/g.11366 Transcript_3417/m.11366 type:complete len:165 (-) Transcript_3417:56-550(-)